MQSRSWMERVRSSLRGCRPQLSLGLCAFDDEYCLDFFGYLISLPILDRYVYEPEGMMDSWRIYYFSESVYLTCGSHFWFLNMPWMFVNVKSEVILPNGEWAKQKHPFVTKESDGRWEAEYPYKYVLNNGDEQNVIAKVCVVRMEWRIWLIKWMPYFAKVRKFIEVNFSEEVGENAGSYKGGTIGCGYEMEPNETPEECLRRMERERDF